MRKSFFAKLLLLFTLIFFILSQQIFSQGREKISLIGENGKITLVAEVTKPGTPGRSKVNVSLIAEKGKISLIGDNGLVIGYIGENGLFNLAKGTLTINLLDEKNRIAGSIGTSGNIRFIIGDPGRYVIGDAGRIALIGENERGIGVIGEKGQILFQKNK